jgi:putative MATE family efflux protein
MKDLTQGSVLRQIVTMSIPITIGMFVQTLYVLIDLYFVGRLGDAALAGVSAAGNIMYVTMALTQMLGVGAVALLARAVGRKDRDEASLVFNQSLAMSLLCAALVLVAAYTLSPLYMHALGADAATTAMGVSYLSWYGPGLALQFAANAIGSALRGSGVVKPTMLVQMLTVLVNALLAPVLIAGWGTGHPLGVAGAGLASSIAIGTGLVMLAWYFVKNDHYVGFVAAQMRPRWAIWVRLLNIGFPSGAEFGCIFIFSAVVYSTISHFGPSAMAGYGVGARIMQAIFLPGMAIAFAVPAIAGQNMGAGAYGRVRETMVKAILLECLIMAFLTLVCKFQPAWLVTTFTTDPASAAVAREFLRVLSWNFVATGVVFVCSGLFQALGNTWPSLFSTATRLLVFTPMAIWLSQRPDFSLTQIWHLSVGTVAMQGVLSLSLLRWQWRRSMAKVAGEKKAPPVPGEMAMAGDTEAA